MSPNDFGKITVEKCRKVAVSDYLKKFREQFKENILTSVMEAAGMEISLASTRTGFGGIRYWFVCPQCERKIGVILVHTITQVVGCRHCLGVEYTKKRFKGMIENNLG